MPDAFLLTPSHKGRPYSSQGIARQFTLACDNARLPDRYSIHSLRHTCATYLLKETGDLRLVQQQLGHASPSVTAVYAKALPETISKAVNGLRGNLLNNKTGRCSECRSEIREPDRQLTIHDTEVEVCPTCCAQISK